MAWFIAALAVATLVTLLCRQLATAWPWLGRALACTLFAPHVLWQVQSGWPTLEFRRDATGQQMAEVSLAVLWLHPLQALNPLNALVWVPGLLLFCHSWRTGSLDRALGLVYLAAAAILLVAAGNRADDLTIAYPGLLAAGASPSSGSGRAVGRAGGARSSPPCRL